MSLEAIYQHHERTTRANALSDAQAREIVLDTTLRGASVKFNDGNTARLNPFVDASAFGSLAQAVTDIGSNSVTLVVTEPMTVTAELTIPVNIATVVLKGGSFVISSGVILTINGPYSGFWGQHFSGAGMYDVEFSQGSTPWVAPVWFGADPNAYLYDDGGGVPLPGGDSTLAIKACLRIAINQFRGIAVNLGSGSYRITETICIRKKVLGTWRICPSGVSGADSAAGYRVGPNPAAPLNYNLTTAPTGIDCCVVLQNGASLGFGNVAVLDYNGYPLDTVANQGLVLVNIEGSFARSPFHDIEVSGFSSGRNLDLVVARYCTTNNLGTFGGYFGKNGFYATQSNICGAEAIYMQNLSRGGTPFLFREVSHFECTKLWTEAMANNTIGFWFRDSSNLHIKILQVGDPDGGSGQLGTSSAGADTITQDTNYLHENDDRIKFTTAPGGLDTTTFYYVVNANSSTFQVSTTSGGAAVNITTSVSVAWQNCIQNAVRFTSCEKVKAYSLNITDYIACVGGKTLISGGSQQLIDDTFNATQSGYGLWTEDRYDQPMRMVIENIDITDTSVYRAIGQVFKGTRLNILLIAKTAGLTLTDGSVNIMKMTGAGFSLKGTASVGSGDLTSMGAAKLVTFDVDETFLAYLAPVTPSGTGIIDAVIEWNRVSGNQ